MIENNDLEHKKAKREALERTSILANERTYAAWIRTGLTSFATLLGFAGLFANVLPSLILRAGIILLFFCSASFFLMGAWRYHHVGIRMVTTNVFGAPIWILTFLSLILVAVTFAIMLGIYWNE